MKLRNNTEKTVAQIENTLVNNYVDKWKMMDNCTNLYGLHLDAIGTVQADLDRMKEKYNSNMALMWGTCSDFYAFYDSYRRAGVAPTMATLKAKNLPYNPPC